MTMQHTTETTIQAFHNLDFETLGQIQRGSSIDTVSMNLQRSKYRTQASKLLKDAPKLSDDRAKELLETHQLLAKRWPSRRRLFCRFPSGDGVPDPMPGGRREEIGREFEVRLEDIQKPIELGYAEVPTRVMDVVYSDLITDCNQVALGSFVLPPSYDADIRETSWHDPVTAKMQFNISGLGGSSVSRALGFAAVKYLVDLDSATTYGFRPTFSLIGNLARHIPETEGSSVKCSIRAFEVVGPSGMAPIAVPALVWEKDLLGPDPMTSEYLDMSQDDIVNPLLIESNLLMQNSPVEVTVEIWVSLEASGDAIAELDMQDIPSFGIRFLGLNVGTLQEVGNVLIRGPGLDIAYRAPRDFEPVIH